ncbi:MAG: hypothetical protein PHH37_07415 [Paludibacter sp.]|nr:hypothetical protein [Paludibacter sp.]
MKNNFREYLKNPPALKYADKLADEILLQPEKFDVFFELMFDEDESIAWKAGWVCDKVSRKSPDLFSDPILKLIINAALKTKHQGTLRSYLSILNNLHLPSPVNIDFINHCFEWMSHPRNDVSIQVLSMKILFSFTQKEPDFIPELLLYLENITQDEYKPGYNAARRKIIKSLKNNTLVQ